MRIQLSHFTPSAILLLAGLIAVQGCGGASKPEPVASESALPVARALAASVEAGNTGYFDSKLDSAAFVEQMLRGVGSLELEKSLSRLELFRELSVGEFVVGDADEGSYTFLRLHTVNGETRALMRILTPAGSLNYHDIILGYHPGTTDVSVRDVFVYNIGDMMSHTFGPLFESVLKQEKGNVVSLVDSLDRMVEYTRVGRTDEMITCYRSLPPAERATKIALSVYLKLSVLAGGAEHNAAIDAYLSHYPNDTGAAMLRLERARLEGKADEGIAAIDALNKIMGGDPVLDHLRGEFLIARGDTAAGAELLRASIAAEPALGQLYWSYLDLLVAQHRDDELRTLLRQLREKGGWSDEDIRTAMNGRAGYERLKMESPHQP